MSKNKLEDMSPIERRDFLKYFSGFLALPMISDKTRFAMAEMIFGSQAQAAEAVAKPTYFLEVNFRDQWDFQCLFQPPSIARSFGSFASRLPPVGSPTAERNNFYLTPYASELKPHLDSIAVIEVGQVSEGGVHGHEAGNPLRSPGRSRSSAAGKVDMSTVDKRPNDSTGKMANEVMFSSSPTPAIMHNYYQKMLTPGIGNGVILRSIMRDWVTCYHFEGTLANAQATRFFDKQTLLSKYSGTSTVQPTLTSLQKHGAIISNVLKRLDEAQLQRMLASSANANHKAKLDSVSQMLQTTTPPASISLALTSQEESYWKTGIIDQVQCNGENAANCVAAPGKWHPAELFAYAGKLFRADRARTVAIDFDITDVHTNRNEFVMKTMAQQSGMTLARLISYLKTNNMWDQTVIAMYTIDGSRSPNTNSVGENSKNALVLAGGKIKGGYYGDISYNSNGQVVYYRPDDNGNPVPNGTTGGDQRIPGADVYKTVLTAAGVPMSLMDSFVDIKPGKVLNYMLKA